MTGQQRPCPAYDVWGGYRLSCILAAGHSGDHLASELEPIDGEVRADADPS